MTHLPAIVVRRGGESHFTAVALCGKRGPIRVREDGAGARGQLDLVTGEPEICSACMVLWDAREEAGELRVLWVPSGRREWAGPGAVLLVERPAPWRCAKCSDAGPLPGFRPDCFAVAVREDRT